MYVEAKMIKAACLLLLTFSGCSTENQPASQSITIDATSTIDYPRSTVSDPVTTQATVEQEASNNLESSTAISHEERRDQGEVLEVARLPQNRIPLRLLQRNKFRPTAATTTTSESTFEPQTNFQRPKPVENMIIDKTRQNSGTAISQGSGNDFQRRRPFPAAYQGQPVVPYPEPRPVFPKLDQQQPQEQILSSSQGSPDLYQSQPIDQRLSEQIKNRQPQLAYNVPLRSRPRQYISPPSTPIIDGDSVGNDTDENATTPFPLPVPLENVPFDLRPRQEIQNRLLELQWQRAGKNISLFYPKATPAPKNFSLGTTKNVTQSTTTVVTTTVTVPTTTVSDTTWAITTTASIIASAPARSYLAEYMVNKHGNAREYLKAIFENKLGGEHQHSEQSAPSV